MSGFYAGDGDDGNSEECPGCGEELSHDEAYWFEGVPWCIGCLEYWAGQREEDEP